METVVDRLLAEHRDLEGLVGLLDRQPSLIVDPEAPNIGLLIDAISYLTRFPDVRHHAFEDRIAERLRSIGALEVEYIDEIEAQHATLARQGLELLQNLESSARDEGMPRELMAANIRLYGERLRHNMAVEELTLFPAAVRSLGEADWQEIIHSAAGRASDPLFDDPVEESFARLRRAIVQQADGT